MIGRSDTGGANPTPPSNYYPPTHRTPPPHTGRSIDRATQPSHAYGRESRPDQIMARLTAWVATLLALVCASLTMQVRA